jgi:Protein of Unknown function (DUF2784)
MMIFRILADLTIVVHFAYVLFVILGLFLTLVGWARRWDWVKNRWFRSIHLATILIVVLEAWVGLTCPLTTLEKWLRGMAGQTAYRGDFIVNWVHNAMFFDASPSVFTIAYTLFGSLVLLTLWFVPPRWRGSLAQT